MRIVYHNIFSITFEIGMKWWGSVLAFIMMEPLLLNKKREHKDRSMFKSEVGHPAHSDMKQTSKHQKDRGSKQNDRLSSYWFPHQFVYVVW
jgi:hypothetical protein